MTEIIGNIPTPPPTSATFLSFSRTKKPLPSGMSTCKRVPASIEAKSLVPSPLIWKQTVISRPSVLQIARGRLNR